LPTVLMGLGVIIATLLTACTTPRPTYKIALAAPFEGHLRQAGYDAFPAFRLALREQIAAGGVGPYQIEFVAYNDNADPAFAARVAHNVVEDARVLAVIGHLLPETSAAAMPVYATAQMPVITLAGPDTTCRTPPCAYAGFVNATPEQQTQAGAAMQHFAEVSGGPVAGSGSIQAYLATRLVLRAVADDVAAHGTPTRAGVGEALSRLTVCRP